MFDRLKFFSVRRARFRHRSQLDSRDCGATCLSMIMDHYGSDVDIESLRMLCNTSREGTTMLNISKAAESLGFRSLGASITLNQLYEEVPLPCILHWKQRHFVVCYGVARKNGLRLFRIADPAAADNLIYTENEMNEHWCVDRDNNQGYALLIEPGPATDAGNYISASHSIKNVSFFLKYLRPYKKHFFLTCLGMLASCLLQLIFPFLTKSLVDVGISESNISFITLILVSQLIISLSQLIVEFTRNWMLLHINARINIGLVSDFLTKLMKLPIRFFESRLIGDILQRIGDHQRIEQFMTGSSLNVFFSLISFIIFGIVLGVFSYRILVIYVVGNSLYLFWVLSFMKIRRTLDIKRFYESAGERSNLIQLITGMTEIKMNNCENHKRWKWERIQIKLFNLKIKSLALGQIQHFGSLLFNQSTNIVISFIAARSVVTGDLSLGSMISITYLVGQLNGPIGSFIGFAQQMQDARLSLERINEVNLRKDETQSAYCPLERPVSRNDIHLRDVYFGYDQGFPIFQGLNLDIPAGKITAIVGESGGGKTTLMKMILGFLEPVRGEIEIGGQNLSLIHPSEWRDVCGAVMQDGFIFSESIAENIALRDERADFGRLEDACTVACIKDFIESLPMGYATVIGMEGHGLSQGQKQRILLARAAYKNPEILFLDEATNALDSQTESDIMDRLKTFFKGKTVIIIAHRLSTVKNADKIVVIKKGAVAEEGTHATLMQKGGIYYRLVKRQLEI